MKIFCIPYAGGSSFLFNSWRQTTNHLIDLHAIELPGRGKKFNEKLNRNMNDTIDFVFNQIKDKLEEPYMLYGHSFGGLIAYELYYKIYNEKLNIPKHIFFSGCKPPNLKSKRKITFNLLDQEFIKEIVKLGGIPREILESNEMLNIFIPILRADFQIVDTYTFNPNRKKILSDVSIINGKNDSNEVKRTDYWDVLVEKKCIKYLLDGGHLFINNKAKEIINIINSTINNG